MFLSDFIRSNSLMAALAGAGAISTNDVVQLNAVGQACTARTSDFAAVGTHASTPFPQTQYSTGTLVATSTSLRRCVYFDPATSCIYLTDADANNYPTVWKFAPGGALLATLTLQANSVAGGATDKGGVALQRLTSGDFVAAWTDAGNNVNFAIFDADLLGVKVGPTVLQNTSGSDAGHPSVLALTAGGFITSWNNQNLGGAYFAINSNTGTVVIAATAIAGTGTYTHTRSSARQLSNSNIVIGILDYNANKIGFTIVQPSGAVVTAFAAIVGTPAISSTSADFPQVAVLPSGYFGISSGRSVNNAQAFCGVFDNTGAQQGALFVGTGGGNTKVVLTQDGTYFWLAYLNAGTTGDALVTRIDRTGGASAVSTSLNTSSLALALTTPSAIEYDADFGLLYYVCGTKVQPLQPTPGGKVSPVGLATVGSLTHVNAFAAFASDGCLVLGGDGYIEVLKCVDTAVLGVAAQSVAAGNLGTQFLFNMGPGGFQVNPFRGRPGIGFDHTVTPVVGNKGTFVTGRSVSLKGI